MLDRARPLSACSGGFATGMQLGLYNSNLWSPIRVFLRPPHGVRGRVLATLVVLFYLTDRRRRVYQDGLDEQVEMLHAVRPVHTFLLSHRFRPLSGVTKSTFTPSSATVPSAGVERGSSLGNSVQLSAKLMDIRSSSTSWSALLMQSNQCRVSAHSLSLALAVTPQRRLVPNE